ncbi:anaphase-promoting complex subunit CDC26-like [Tribolium madens]|uniref:anaphase-promoting complex subunit CDC26-like n=1 Tax=Tribolium madens TaxID=41895 RepID=UPI001CF756B0|nr:anaphase-promoting complex subunit CDC26-like [Tribolium madens]
MLRRPPTTIELKVDDIREYEYMRQQIAKEQEKGKGFEGAPNWQSGPKSKEEVYSRIGYVPPEKTTGASCRPNLL